MHFSINIFNPDVDNFTGSLKLINNEYLEINEIVTLCESMINLFEKTEEKPMYLLSLSNQILLNNAIKKIYNKEFVVSHKALMNFLLTDVQTVPHLRSKQFQEYLLQRQRSIDALLLAAPQPSISVTRIDFTTETNPIKARPFEEPLSIFTSKSMTNELSALVRFVKKLLLNEIDIEDRQFWDTIKYIRTPMKFNSNISIPICTTFKSMFSKNTRSSFKKNLNVLKLLGIKEESYETPSQISTPVVSPRAIHRKKPFGMALQAFNDPCNKSQILHVRKYEDLINFMKNPILESTEEFFEEESDCGKTDAEEANEISETEEIEENVEVNNEKEFEEDSEDKTDESNLELEATDVTTEEKETEQQGKSNI